MTGVFHRLTKFGLVGVVGTALHYVTLVLLVEIGDVDPVIAATAGFIVGGVTNYMLNYRYTFHSAKDHLDAGPKFFLVATVTGALNAAFVFLGVHVVHFNYLLVQIVATGAMFLLNFTLNNSWTFGRNGGLRKRDDPKVFDAKHDAGKP